MSDMLFYTLMQFKSCISHGCITTDFILLDIEQSYYFLD